MRYDEDMIQPESDPVAASVYSGNGMGQHYTDPNHPVVRRSVSLVSETGAQTVWDMGCGSGIVSLALSQETSVRDIVATDINPESVGRLRDLATVAGYPITALVKSVGEAGFPDKTWIHSGGDVVISKDVYPFLKPEEADIMLENAADTLRPGGWLIMSAPSVRSQLFKESEPSAAGNPWYRRIGQEAQDYIQTDLDHFLFTDIPDLSQRLQSLGIETVEAQHFGRAGGWLMMVGQMSYQNPRTHSRP